MYGHGQKHNAPDDQRQVYKKNDIADIHKQKQKEVSSTLENVTVICYARGISTLNQHKYQSSNV